RAVHAHRDVVLAAYLDERRILGVVHLDRPAELEREVRRDELLELAAAGAAREPARDQDRLTFDGNADARQLVHGRLERRLPRIVLRARQRERRELDDDRRATPARYERLERLAG